MAPSVSGWSVGIPTMRLLARDLSIERGHVARHMRLPLMPARSEFIEPLARFLSERPTRVAVRAGSGDDLVDHAVIAGEPRDAVVGRLAAALHVEDAHLTRRRPDTGPSARCRGADAHTRDCGSANALTVSKCSGSEKSTSAGATTTSASPLIGISVCVCVSWRLSSSQRSRPSRTSISSSVWPMKLTQPSLRSELEIGGRVAVALERRDHAVRRERLARRGSGVSSIVRVTRCASGSSPDRLPDRPAGNLTVASA